MLGWQARSPDHFTIYYGDTLRARWTHPGNLEVSKLPTRPEIWNKTADFIENVQENVIHRLGYCQIDSDNLNIFCRQKYYVIISITRKSSGNLTGLS